MSVFLQMSLLGVGDILWVLRSTLHTHIPCEGGWLRCRSSSLLVNEWFRRGVAGSQSFGHRRYTHWKYGHSMWGTRWVLSQDVCGCGLVGWEPLSLTQVDSALPSFLSKDVCSLGRWIAFPTCPPRLLLHQGQRWEWNSLTQSICQQYVNLCHRQRCNTGREWIDACCLLTPLKGSFQKRIFLKMYTSAQSLKAGPLDLSIWSFGHFVWKVHKKFKGKILLKCPTEVARLTYKVTIQSCTQNRSSPKYQPLSRD